MKAGKNTKISHKTLSENDSSKLLIAEAMALIWEMPWLVNWYYIDIRQLLQRFRHLTDMFFYKETRNNDDQTKITDKVQGYNKPKKLG